MHAARPFVAVCSFIRPLRQNGATMDGQGHPLRWQFARPVGAVRFQPRRSQSAATAARSSLRTPPPPPPPRSIVPPLFWIAWWLLLSAPRVRRSRGAVRFRIPDTDSQMPAEHEGEKERGFIDLWLTYFARSISQGPGMLDVGCHHRQAPFLACANSSLSLSSTLSFLPCTAWASHSSRSSLSLSLHGNSKVSSSLALTFALAVGHCSIAS